MSFTDFDFELPTVNLKKPRPFVRFFIESKQHEGKSAAAGRPGARLCRRDQPQPSRYAGLCASWGLPPRVLIRSQS